MITAVLHFRKAKDEKELFQVEIKAKDWLTLTNRMAERIYTLGKRGYELDLVKYRGDG